MNVFQNSNVVSRCPAGLKAKMKAFAEANEQHLSAFIRSACVEVLRREMDHPFFNVPSEADIERRLAEMEK